MIAGPALEARVCPNCSEISCFCPLQLRSAAADSSAKRARGAPRDGPCHLTASQACSANGFGRRWCRISAVDRRSAAAGFTCQTLVNQHLQEGLIAKALAAGEFAGLRDIRFRQAKSDLYAALPVQFRNETRSPDCRPFRLGLSGFLFHINPPCPTGPPIRFLSLALELWHHNRFLVHNVTVLALASGDNRAFGRRRDRRPLPPVNRRCAPSGLRPAGGQRWFRHSTRPEAPPQRPARR